MKERLRYVFCHGMAGWGEYDDTYKKFPYWGTVKGDLLKKFRGMGYLAHGASVSPYGSAWDRACELYAQLFGTRVDYGKHHSEKYGHERYGEDYAGRALFGNEEGRLVLLGHSFGGVTVRLLAELLANGDAEEREHTDHDELSGLFEGGKKDLIKAIVTLAAPTNGTTAYDMYDDPSFDTSVEMPFRYKMFAKGMSTGTSVRKDGRDERDYCDHDMHIDNALKLNERISTLEDVYYFSIPCYATQEDEKGDQVPMRKLMDPMFMRSSVLMGRFEGTTREGLAIGPEWKKNDGLVNTISARAPFNAPQKQLDEANVEKGMWNVFPDYEGGHACLQGGFFARHDPLDIYLKLFGIIENCE